MATSYQDDYLKTALRLPRELHARIQESAIASGKSLNSELIARLEQSFSHDERASAEALMLEMRRTQLLLRRSQFQADASREFFAGSEDAKRERAYRDANPDPADIRQAKKGANTARVKADNLSNELTRIDGQVVEIERRLQQLGYTIDFVSAPDPTDHQLLVLNKPSKRKV